MGQEDGGCVYSEENHFYGDLNEHAYDTSFADSVQVGTEKRRRGG